MSGFIGFINTVDKGAEGTPKAKEIVADMLAEIAHRGVDGAGVHVDPDIALGARWLDTLTVGGTQPFQSEDGSKLLVYDGEIYNHEELRDELIAAGHTFSTTGDGEVILHGFEEWGLGETLERLRGKFAFVIWDSVAKKMVGARDPFGVKPLYYYTTEGPESPPMIFGSEIKTFLKHPHFEKELNTGALANYLSFQYSGTDEALFKNVYRIRPAHYFIADGDTFETVQYWRPHFDPIEGTIEQYADQIDEAVDEAVALHKQAAPGVEVGSFLSSGVDSSYIASKANVDKTFTVGFVRELYNETDYAKAFADTIDVENYSKVITPEEYWGELAHIQYHMDEPLADPAAIGLYFASQLVSDHVKVVLSGEGADELFAGYGVYRTPLQRAARVRKLLPASVWKALGVISSPIYAIAPQLPGHDFLVRRNKPLKEWFIGGADIFSVDERNKILKVGKDAPTPQEITAPFYAEAQGYDDVTEMQYLDIHLWSSGDILLKADRMTSAHSIEVRSPLLDREIMKLAQRLPLSAKVDTVHTKKAFREAASRSIPQLTAQKDKLGFPVPIRVWLKEDEYYNKVKEAFTSEVAEQFFHTDELVRLLDEHHTGTSDNARKIWTVYMFLVWYDEFFVKR
ncbi:MAG: asparagine synthase (glutamine-hydrolyzing) [Coriobacteriia bacterium]|nr:asparagine synthase (glutamine-hydrolyzing) [Coriobacteriia bacterium]